MNERLKEIKKLESSPKVIKNLYSKGEIEEFLQFFSYLKNPIVWSIINVGSIVNNT